MTDDRFTIAVIGAGSAASSLIEELSTSQHRIVVFEPRLVGGECPFLACVPSKAMLHDSTSGRSWADAVARRNALVDHLDDSSHARPLRESGATIVRERAVLAGPGAVDSGGRRYAVDHVVIATGAAPVFPDVDGLDRDHPRVWTHRDVLTASERPSSVIVLGGGVIGTELAFMLAGFGTDVTTIDVAERPFPELHPRIGEIVEDVLTDRGVEVVDGVEVTRVDLSEDAVRVHLDDGTERTADRLVVAAGRRRDLSGLELESIGVHPDEIEIDDTGRLVTNGARHGASPEGGVTGTADGASVWVIGDAAGRGQYTHLANQHGVVVADQIAGAAERRFGDVVTPSCVFIDPPLVTVGPTWEELADDDVVRVGVETETARHNTDERRAGFVAAAADPSTGCIVAAQGVGPAMDEIAHALVVAIDGRIPVSRLRQTLQPFPTLGGALSEVYEALHRELASLD